MTAIARDVRYAIRNLARSPGWTAAAVLTLGLGVGANTTVYSWVRGVLIDPIPSATEAGRLRVVYGIGPSGDTLPMSYPNYREVVARTGVFAGVVAQRWVNLALGASSGQPPRRLSGALVSGNYFDVLGVRPSLGRAFAGNEDAGAGAPPVAVLSHLLWTRSFGSDASIVGKAISLNGRPFTVVGVAPAKFYGGFLGVGVDVFVPMAQVGRLEPGGDRLEDRGDRWVQLLARLKPGVTDGQARAALAAEAVREAREFPAFNEGSSIGLATLSQSPWGAPEVLRPVLLTLSALVALVLLIACANIANLLLARALGRRHEVAVRLALGADRGRLVRQFLTESLVLGALAGTAAFLLTFWTSGLLLSFMPPTGRPVRIDLAVDASVLLFAFAASAVSSVLFGLLPALQASRATIASDLASETGSIGGAWGRARLSGTLVVAQIALSLVLLVAAALFLRSLSAARSMDPGFDVRRMLLVEFDLFPLGYTKERGVALFDSLQERVRALPGVREAAIARRVPLGFGGSSSGSVEVDGYMPSRGEQVNISFNYISAGYFRTMGIPVRRGREFAGADRDGAPPVVVVNETFARRYFAGREAVNGRIRQGSSDWLTIVGVAADGKYRSIGEAPVPYLFFPIAQVYRPGVVLHVRTREEPTSVVAPVRAVVRQLDPNLPISGIQTMDEHMQEAFLAQRIASGLLGVLGLLALAIASVGLYGIAAYAVAGRRREIGVRMALGASPGRILKGFLAGGLRLAAVGAGIGLVAALSGTRLLARLLPGIRPTDPIAYAGVALVVAAIAIAATWLPARRAAGISPMEALRNE